MNLGRTMWGQAVAVAWNWTSCDKRGPERQGGGDGADWAEIGWMMPLRARLPGPLDAHARHRVVLCVQRVDGAARGKGRRGEDGIVHVDAV